ncbi:Protein of unknown function [Actinokineospora alba]|uniref:DUF3558 domain-containing protein n=1 Tax=Actinokineospora alba TaxID=504798 RepID=A0A1H0PPL3_9PSEU|nr:DUF3558 family protein [Actinokineospora alba]TDP65890.1 uncharacterized protein DUF3558 [Actinokineospora alba]SDI62815.1 Protein of unknown function [Actinokineospora alba]SDP06993.1 Protein of unknown function [Actinokineospora alba]
MGTNAARLAVSSVTAFAALALTACSEPTPAPVTTTPKTSESTETTDKPSPTKKTTAPPKVDRPADKDLSAVNPCDVMNTLKLSDYGMDNQVPGFQKESSIFPGSQGCTAAGITSNLTVGIESVVTQGMKSWVEGANGETKQIKIEGYPAATVAPKRGISCYAVVDTKDGQMMFFQLLVSNDSRQPVTPQPELCTRVVKMAEAGMKVVLAR